VNSHDISTSDFFKTLGEFQSGPERPKPIYVTIDGNTGIWNEERFNQQEQKKVKVPFHTGSEWNGSILAIRWFAQQAYVEGKQSKVKRRTREFTNWDDKVEVLEIDYSKNQAERTKSLVTFNSYKEFKDWVAAEYGMAVNKALAAKESIPQQDEYSYDLWASVYVYDFELGRIVNVKLKSMSRKAVFDYRNEWKQVFEVDSISQVLTNFSSVEFDKPIHYYAAKLRGVRVLDEGEQGKVREAITQLYSWMKSFENEKPQEEKPHEPVAVISDAGQVQVEEIRLEDIPF
jgi:hypothetical protein